MIIDRIDLKKALKNQYPDATFNIIKDYDNDFNNPGRGTIKIKNWVSASAKPQIDDVIAVEKIARKLRKKALLEKLGLTKDDLDTFIDLIDDRTDD